MNSPRQTYHVTADQLDGSRARVTARGHDLTLSIKKGSGEAGFNAAETLLAALGACMLTNVNAISAKMRLHIDSARIEFDAVRRDDPPGLMQVDCRLILDSPEPAAKLHELHELSVKWGTVTNTLTAGLTPHGSLVLTGRQAGVNASTPQT